MMDAMFDLPSAGNRKNFKVTLEYAKAHMEKANINKLKAVS